MSNITDEQRTGRLRVRDDGSLPISSLTKSSGGGYFSTPAEQ